MDYIRKHYSVPAKCGGRIIFDLSPFSSPRRGVITGSRGGYLMVRFDGETNPSPLHPKWGVTYL